MIFPFILMYCQILKTDQFKQLKTKLAYSLISTSLGVLVHKLSNKIVMEGQSSASLLM